MPLGKEERKPVGHFPHCWVALPHTHIPRGPETARALVGNVLSRAPLPAAEHPDPHAGPVHRANGTGEAALPPRVDSCLCSHRRQQSLRSFFTGLVLESPAPTPDSSAPTCPTPLTSCPKESVSKTEVTVFCNPFSEVISYQFCHILFVRSQALA